MGKVETSNNIDIDFKVLNNYKIFHNEYTKTVGRLTTIMFLFMRVYSVGVLLGGFFIRMY